MSGFLSEILVPGFTLKEEINQLTVLTKNFPSVRVQRIHQIQQLQRNCIVDITCVLTKLNFVFRTRLVVLVGASFAIRVG